MADQSRARRKRSGQFTWLWMLLSLVMVGGFLAWLAVTSEPTSVAVAERDTDGVAGAGQSMRVSLAQLAPNPLAYQGQQVEVAEVSVASRIGPRLFWTQFPNNTPFLVRLGESLAAQGVTVTSGETLVVTGRIVNMTDSVMTAWKADGTITTPDQQVEAEFATSFLDAESVRSAGAPSPGASE